MTFAVAITSLLFDPKSFFADPATTGSLRMPGVFTIIYAVLMAVVIAMASGKSAELFGMSDLAGMLQGVGVVTGFFTVLISWIVITAIFFVFIKFMTHTQSGLKPFLAVTGYASLPLLVGTVLMLLVTTVFPGAFDGWAGFLLSLAVLIWCLPIWGYGFAAAGSIPVRAVVLAIAIPLLVMIAYTAWNTYAGIETIQTLADTGSVGGVQISSPHPQQNR